YDKKKKEYNTVGITPDQKKKLEAEMKQIGIRIEQRNQFFVEKYQDLKDAYQKLNGLISELEQLHNAAQNFNSPTVTEKAFRTRLGNVIKKLKKDLKKQEKVIENILDIKKDLNVKEGPINSNQIRKDQRIVRIDDEDESNNDGSNIILKDL